MNHTRSGIPNPPPVHGHASADDPENSELVLPAAVAELLARIPTLSEYEVQLLAEFRKQQSRAAQTLQRKMPRDYAWTQLHARLAEVGLTPQFKALWQMGSFGIEFGHADLVIRDAACALLLDDRIDHRTYTRSDHDVLLAPWRAATRSCERSRLALAFFARWPYPAADAWPIIDQVLAPPTRSQPRP